VLSGFDAQFGTTCSFTRLSLQGDAPQDVCRACAVGHQWDSVGVGWLQRLVNTLG